MRTASRRAHSVRPLLGLLAILGLVASGLGVTLLAAPASATTPGENGRIAYKSYLDPDRTTGAVFTISAQGDRARQLTFPPPGTVDDQPDWSPDGSLVAFRRCAPHTVCALYTVRADGSAPRRLSAPCTARPPHIETKCADESEVAFLPDGRHVVLTRSTGLVSRSYIEHSDIVIRDLADGRDTVVLRSAPFAGDNAQMVVSPDGTHIAFQRHNAPITAPPNGAAVFVVDVDGSNLHRITPWALHAGDHLDWSPDGRWILFRSNVDGGFLDSQFYLAHPDGSALHAITHVAPTTALLSASFSPRGGRVVFSGSGRAGQPDLFTMRTDGSDVERVTRTPVWDSAPDWGPESDG